MRSRRLKSLAKEWVIEAEVIDLRTLRPMDLPTVIESVKKTNRCVTVEEGWPVARSATNIAAACMHHAFDYLDAPVAGAGKDVPMPYAANLEKLALPNVGRSGRGGQSRPTRVRGGLRTCQSNH
jgi:pyruvate dehydrogenase E1 component beta subunit